MLNVHVSKLRTHAVMCKVGVINFFVFTTIYYYFVDWGTRKSDSPTELKNDFLVQKTTVTKYRIQN